MADITDEQLNKDIDEAIAIVNGTAPIRPHKLVSLNESPEEWFLKIVNFDLGENESYRLRTQAGLYAGKVSINFNLKERGTLFKIYRDKKLIISGVKDTTLKIMGSSKESVKDSFSAYKTNSTHIDFANHINELIANKEYDDLDQYISSCMEKIVTDETLSSLRNLYIKVQVLLRNIAKIKGEIKANFTLGIDCTKEEKELDINYREICELFLNAGLYEEVLRRN